MQPVLDSRDSSACMSRVASTCTLRLYYTCVRTSTSPCAQPLPPDFRSTMLHVLGKTLYKSRQAWSCSDIIPPRCGARGADGQAHTFAERVGTGGGRSSAALWRPGIACCFLGVALLSPWPSKLASCNAPGWAARHARRLCGVSRTRLVPGVPSLPHAAFLVCARMLCIDQHVHDPQRCLSTSI